MCCITEVAALTKVFMIAKAKVRLNPEYNIRTYMYYAVHKHQNYVRMYILRHVYQNSQYIGVCTTHWSLSLNRVLRITNSLHKSICPLILQEVQEYKNRSQGTHLNTKFRWSQFKKKIVTSFLVIVPPIIRQIQTQRVAAKNIVWCISVCN